MAFASGSQRGAAYCAETSFGVTPSSPSMSFIRHSGMNLNLAKSTIVSPEIREDRQIADLRHGNRNPSGNIPMPLIYGAADDFIEAVFGGAWDATTNVLNLGNTFRSFTVEDRFTDIGQYRVYTGVVMDSMQVSIQPGTSGAIVTSTFATMGKDMAINTAQIAAPTEVSTSQPFDTFSGSVQVGGTDVLIANSVDFTIANNFGQNYVVGSPVAASMTPGQIKVTGTITTYLEDAVLADYFLNETENALVVTVGDGTNTQTYTFPRVKLNSADVDTNTQAVNQSLSFEALYDTTSATAASVTRTAA